MKILRAHPEIQLIHASTYTSGIPASLLGGRFGKPRILTVHEIFGTLRKRFKPRYSRRLFQLFEWFTFQVRYEAYHCVSLYTLNSLRMYY
ncbi:glycosyltransferase [bacterium]|nr:glycosyltransferase [bacterium]